MRTVTQSLSAALAQSVANDYTWGVWYTMPGSDELYRVCEYRKPREWKRRTGADRFARQSMAPSGPLGQSLGADRVYVGTPSNPRFARVH